MRFRVEELFLDSKSGAFQLEESRIRSAKALERLYLIVALGILFATSQGMAVQLEGLRTQVDPHHLAWSKLSKNRLTMAQGRSQ